MRASHTDVALTFSYQTELPGDQAVLQDEVEIVLTHSTFKVITMGMQDNLEAVEKAVGTIGIPAEVLEQMAIAKAGLALQVTTLQQAIKGLVLISQFPGAYSDARVDVIVDSYLAGFGAETAAKRQELAAAFRNAVSPSETSDRILKRILREDHVG
jgi:hypothetical protein